jgi:hypothetical protein
LKRNLSGEFKIRQLTEFYFRQMGRVKQVRRGRIGAAAGGWQ